MMNKFLVGANVLIRLVVKDDYSKVEVLRQLIEKVDNKELMLIVPTITIAECCWLLKSFY